MKHRQKAELFSISIQVGKQASSCLVNEWADSRVQLIGMICRVLWDAHVFCWPKM